MTTSKQVKIYAGPDTHAKWTQICTGFSSNSAAFAALVENYHIQKETQMNLEITTIRYGFHAADLFAGWDDEEKYNIPASAAKYAELIKAELKKQYPGAEIETPYDLDAGGVLPAPLQAAVNDNPNHDDVPVIDHIAAQVYESYDWTVEN